jgi:hypothetical protein
MLPLNEFLLKIIVEILKQPKADIRYKIIYGVSHNILSYYFSGNAKALGHDCSIFVQKLVLNEIKNSYDKQSQINNYLKSILSVKDKSLIKEKNTKNFLESILIKFEEGKNYELINPENSEWKNKNLYAKKIKDLFELIKNYINNKKIFYIFSLKILEEILNCIKVLENLEQKSNLIEFLSGTNIVPKRILMSMSNILEESNCVEEIKDENTIIDLTELCFINVKIVTKWFLNNYLNSIEFRIENDSINREKKINLDSIHIYEYINMGNTIEQYIIECFNMWNDTLGTELPESHKGSVEQWVPIINENLDNQKILINSNNEFIGFWDFEPLFDNPFKKLKDGVFFDDEMSVDVIPTMFPGGTYNIYIMNILLKHKYRNNLSFQKLFYSMVNYIEELALNGVFINEICAWAYTDKGISICKSIGLKYHKDHIEHGKIYIGKVIDILNKPISSDFSTLKELYNKKHCNLV